MRSLECQSCLGPRQHVKHVASERLLSLSWVRVACMKTEFRCVCREVQIHQKALVHSAQRLLSNEISNGAYSSVPHFERVRLSFRAKPAVYRSQRKRSDLVDVWSILLQNSLRHLYCSKNAGNLDQREFCQDRLYRLRVVHIDIQNQCSLRSPPGSDVQCLGLNLYAPFNSCWEYVNVYVK